VRYGLHLPQLGRAASPARIVDIAKRAENLGFDDVWVSDHVAVPTALEGPPSFFPEPVPLLSLVAGHTERVRLGTSVLIPAYRNPLQLAKQWATLDWLAPGRTILGVGAGWLPEEFAACGVSFERRGRRLDDYIAGCRAAWAGQTDFDSEFFTFHGARIRPQPAEWVPIWSGGSSPAAITRAARNDGWHPTAAPVEVFAAGLALLRREVDRLGRDPAVVTVSMHLEVRLGERIAGAGYWSKAGDGHGERNPRGGSPEQLAGVLDAYEEVGLQHVLLTPQCRSGAEWDEQLDGLAQVLGRSAARPA